MTQAASFRVPISINAADHPHLPSAVKQLLTELKNNHEQQLIGNYAQDFPDYRYRTGVIRGISEAIAICEDVERKLRE